MSLCYSQCYQNVWYDITLLPIGLWTVFSEDRAKIILDVLFNLRCVWVRKCKARPLLRFFSSIRITPVEILLNQILNLPLPLPILEPITFLVKGKCGKVLSQTLRPVLSDLRADFFKKSFSRNIFLLLIIRGFVKTRPIPPKINRLANLTLKFKRRRLCLSLNLNFLGWSTTSTFFGKIDI